MHDEKRPEQNEDKPRIKVTDRRKFTPQGELREHGTVGATDPATSEDATAGKATTDGATRSTTTADASEPARESTPSEQPAVEEQASRPEGAVPDIASLPRDFTAFVEGMYLEAMLYLGALPDPRSGETSEDLDMAKYKIDLLGMIQEKTRGNLSEEEAQQLEEVLYQLRMFYVQRGKGPKG